MNDKTGFLRLRYDKPYAETIKYGQTLLEQSLGQKRYNTQIVDLLKRVKPVKEYREGELYITLFPMDFNALRLFRFAIQNKIATGTLTVVEEA